MKTIINVLLVLNVLWVSIPRYQVIQTDRTIANKVLEKHVKKSTKCEVSEYK